MTQNLAQNLVHLSNGSLCPNRSPKLSLYHAECGFDIRPLVIVLQETVSIEVVEVPHSVPQPIELMMVVSHASRVHLEGDIGCATNGLNGMEITPIRISLISRDLVNIERLGGLGYQSRELGCISRFIGCSLDTGDNVGFDTAHQVSLNPILMAANLAPFVVEPASIGAGGEARGINGKISFDCFQRACALLNKSLEKRSQFGIFQGTEATGERWRLINQSVRFGFSKVSHEASAGHSAVDLVDSTENDIGQWESRSLSE